MTLRTLALADNCIDVYYKLDRYYLTGNSIDFAINYHQLGGDVTEMTVLGNDPFALAMETRLAEMGLPLRVIAHIDKPTGMATMDLVGNDRKHLHFSGNVMEDIEFSADDFEFIKGFDIVYAERWAKIERFVADIKMPNQKWVYDFSFRLEQKSNSDILPYLDYTFCSYERDDNYIRDYLVRTQAQGPKCAVAMLGEYGSLAYDGAIFHKVEATKVQVVNTVGAGDSYIAAFIFGISLGESIDTCMERGRDRATQVIQTFKPYL